MTAAIIDARGPKYVVIGAGAEVALTAAAAARASASQAALARDVAITAGPYYDSIALGEAATTTGQEFAVASGDGHATWYRRTVGGSEFIFTPATVPLGGYLSSEFESFAAASAATITASVDIVTTTGRNAAGDGGGATYVRWATPMTALVANQEGYSWFESADGAQWTLIDVEVRPEMFGAMGHATNDEGLAIRRMFEHAIGKTVLITKVHRYKAVNHDQDIRIYSNTRVQGISALTCGFKRIPNIAVTDAMAEPSFGVYWQDANNIEINDIFHDVQRSGLGHPSESSQRVNGFLARGQNGRWRVNHCIVHNATGYAFYTGAVGAGNSADGIFEDCIAYNSQVSFEETGLNTNIQLIRCHSRQYVNDGGSPVLYECGFHQYGGIAGAYHYQCTHRGVSTAVLTVIVEDGSAHDNVVYDDCDFQNDNASIATVIVRNDYFATPAHPGNGKRAQAKFVGGKIRNTLGPGTSITAGDLEIDGTQIISQTVTAAFGANSIVALRGNFDIQCIMPVTASSGAAAVAMDIDATAVATRTPSGSITATHLNSGSEVAVSGTISLVDDTVFDPPLGGGPLGTEAPRIIQRLRGFKVEGGSGSTDFINAGGNVYWASMVLLAIPTGWTTSSQDTDFNKVTVQASLELAGQAGVVSTVPHGIHWYRRPGVAQGEVFFVINSTAALPANTRLRYDIIEEA